MSLPIAALTAPPWSGPARFDAAVVLAGTSADVVPADQIGHEWARLDVAVAARIDRQAYAVDRLDRLAARRLARLAVASLFGALPDVVELTQRCPGCAGTDHGVPSARFTGINASVSWAHSGGRVAAAAGPAHLRLGVDVETGDGGGWPGTTPSERGRLASLTSSEESRTAFRRLWSAKEALVKAGLLRLDQLARVELPEPNAAGAPGLGGARWRTYDGPDGTVVGVAVASIAQARLGRVP